MSKGKAKVNYLHREGLVGHDTAPDWGFIYETSLVKSESYNIGDRVVLPDGREFIYAKSAAACVMGLGVEFTYTGYVAYTAAAVAAAVGAKEITVPAATHAALTKDELRGGFVVMHQSGKAHVRGIIGNDASILNVAFKIYLDGPITAAVVAATTGIEVFQNPYAALQSGTSVALAKAGMPAVEVAAALTYFWVQKSGPTFVSPQAGITGKNRTGCWRHDGSLDTLTNGVDASASVSSQIAGYAITGSADGNGPLFMLQG